jgi:hypothetical protein
LKGFARIEAGQLSGVQRLKRQKSEYEYEYEKAEEQSLLKRD